MIAKKTENWRVRVDYSDLLIRDELDARALARFVENLRGVSAWVEHDTYYECSNRGSTYTNKADLQGCCEANPLSGPVRYLTDGQAV